MTQKLKSLNEVEYHDTLIDLFSEINGLTGAYMHAEDWELKVQIGILKKFIASSSKFMTLTKAEISHAFYLNNQGEYEKVYKHYGKPLNAEFIGDVLSAYMKLKKPLHGMLHEVMAVINPPVVIEVPRPTAADWRLMIQYDYNLYRAGELDMIVNASPKYIYLRQIGYIVLTSKAKWVGWYKQAVEYRKTHIAAQKTATWGQLHYKEQMLNLYETIERERIIPVSEHRLLVHLARRLMYLKLFEILKDTAINNIFEEIKLPENNKL